MSAFPTTLAFLNFTPFELLIVGVVLLLVFGRRLPEVGKNLGKGIVEFKKGLSGIEDDIKRTDNPPPQQAQLPQQPPVSQNVGGQQQATGPVDQTKSHA